MPDFDQSGTSRQWARYDLGPSVGLMTLPLQSVFPITAAGTYTLFADVSQVTVNVAGAVTIILPRATQPSAGAMAQPGLFGNIAITIVDIGGHAGANPITIQPAPGETIMGLTSISISANYGAFTLAPNSASHLWNAT